MCRPYADRSNNSLGCCNPLGPVGLLSLLSYCGLMDMASHVNDADDNVDAADDDVYAGYVFISVTAGSNFFSLLAIAFIMFFFCLFFSGAAFSARVQRCVCVIFNE